MREDRGIEGKSMKETEGTMGIWNGQAEMLMHLLHLLQLILPLRANSNNSGRKDRKDNIG